MDLLHIGGDAMVDIGEVIAIVSRDTAMRSRDTRSGRIRSISDAPEKSYVLMERNGALTVWSSPIAAETLLKRAAGRVCALNE